MIFLYVILILVVAVLGAFLIQYGPFLIHNLIYTPKDSEETISKKQHISKVDFFKMEGSKKYTTIKRLNIKRR